MARENPGVGERLKTLRARRGWSLPQLAERANVNHSTIWKIEEGKTSNPGAETLRKLSGALGVDLSEITGERPMPRRRAEVFEGVAMVPVMRVRVQASGHPTWDDTRETVYVDLALAAGRPNIRAAALAAALAAIRDKHGHLAVAKGMPPAPRMLQRRPEADPLPPWWPGRLGAAARVVELAGTESCGKLSLALLWLAAAVPHGLVAVVDGTRSFYPPSAAAAGLDLDRVVVVRPPGPRESIEAMMSLVGCGGFEAILWPLTRRTAPSASLSIKVAQLASRTGTTILSLFERPHRRAEEWTGLTSADLRLAVARHRWRMTDGELAGLDLVVRADRLRGMAVPDWAFSLDSRDGLHIASSGAKPTPATRVALRETSAQAV